MLAKYCRLAQLTNLCASIFCAGALLSPLVSHAADNQSQLKLLQQDIAEKEKAVKQQQQQRILLQNQLEQQEKMIAQFSQTLYETQQTLVELEKEISVVNQSVEKLQIQYQKQQRMLANQLDAAFRQGQHNALQLMLSSEESQRRERILAYFSYLNESRQQSIAQLNQTQHALTEQKQALQLKQAKQTNLLENQQIQQKRLEQTRSVRKKTLIQLEASLQKDQVRLAELRQNESGLRDKIAKAEREAKARTEKEAREAERLWAKEQQARQAGKSYKPTESERQLMARTGGIGRPSGQLLWPVRGRVEHYFGDALAGELRWKGMVISAGEGIEVKAIAGGRVLLADWLRGYGLVIIIEHGKGDMSLYGYNQSALVKVGQHVKAGQAIARVGSSGGQGVPSLYFEIRRQGQAVNPLPWLGK
nr:murein hydrolase activator EnvC [Serratia microhaemolytica]